MHAARVGPERVGPLATPGRRLLVPGETALELAADFAFRPTTASTRRAARACDRYLAIIFGQKELWPHATAPAGAPSARSSSRRRTTATPRQKLGDDESFALRVNASGAALEARSFSGVQRGLEAFAQLTINVAGVS